MPDVELAPLPFEAAKAFWAAKVKLSPGEFSKLSAEAKVKAFAVSGIAKGDELNTVYNALHKALNEGISFAEFKRDCAAIFEKRGWTGKRAWRVDNIFRTNIQTAYNVGRYKQLLEETDFFPYWMYDAVNDSRTRPTHLAMDGRVFPADSPVWDKWYPPNGFRCRCSVQPLTRGQVERRGLTVESDDPTNTPVFPVDPKTGLPSTVPVQLLPDPGFGINPGKEFWQPITQALTDKVTAWPQPLAAMAAPGIVSGPVFKAWYANPQGSFPVAVIRADQAALIGVSGDKAVAMSQETARKQLARHQELSSAEYANVQAAIDQGRMLQDGERSLVFILEEAAGYVSVVKATTDGDEVFLTSFRRLSSDGAKRDREVARLLAKGMER